MLKSGQNEGRKAEGGGSADWRGDRKSRMGGK